MSNLAQDFSDPLDPSRSLQLNNRYWKADTFKHLDVLRQAEDDISNRRVASARKTLKHVKALLPANVHRLFVSRLVYSIVYRTTFEPIRFSITLSPELLAANRYNGSENEVVTGAVRTEELRHIVDMIHGIYRHHYGMDIVSSSYAVRYMNAKNPDAARRMTMYGAFSDFHLDEGKDFTCILYLTDVGPQNGCFSYIDGSNGVPKSHVLRALHQVVDAMGVSITKQDELLKLPLELRGSMALGNFLDDEKHDRLSKARVDVLGPPGTGIIFNGFDTIHRGGKPLVGERQALFISTKGHVNKRVKKALYDQLAYRWL